MNPRLILGRLFLGAIFVFSCYTKSTPEAFPEVVKYVSGILPPEFPTEYVKYLLILSNALEGIGGLLLASSIAPRLGATLLVLFLIPTTYLNHFPFKVDNEGNRHIDQNALIQALKNLSILGGLFIATGMGGGAKKAPRRAETAKASKKTE
eukprot:tig00000789_g4094.t1